MKNICEIYKITSPSGRIYIGQAVDIKDRWDNYRPANCKTQTKLYNSFLKYTVKNHIFEVVEECEPSELNNREGYWQDFYDVVKSGLNCRRVKSDDKSGYVSRETVEKSRLANTGINSKTAKTVIDIETGVYYTGAREAAKFNNIREDALGTMLLGKRKNITSLIYCDDYENGKLPSNLFIPNKHRKVRQDYKIINIITGVIYYSLESAAKAEGITIGIVRGYLKGTEKDNNFLMYLTDYEKGLPPKSRIKNNNSKRVIDIVTNIEYKSIREACRELGLCNKRISDKLKNNDFRNINLRYK